MCSRDLAACIGNDCPSRRRLYNLRLERLLRLREEVGPQHTFIVDLLIKYYKDNPTALMFMPQC